MNNRYFSGSEIYEKLTKIYHLNLPSSSPKTLRRRIRFNDAWRNFLYVRAVQNWRKITQKCLKNFSADRLSDLWGKYHSILFSSKCLRSGKEIYRKRQSYVYLHKPFPVKTICLGESFGSSSCKNTSKMCIQSLFI